MCAHAMCALQRISYFYFPDAKMEKDASMIVWHYHDCYLATWKMTVVVLSYSILCQILCTYVLNCLLEMIIQFFEDV